jgi:hypothetical protein
MKLILVMIAKIPATIFDGVFSMISYPVVFSPR